jgi:threonine/homoserine efflux transporter RhtA
MEQRETPRFDWLYVLAFCCLAFGSWMLSIFADTVLGLPHGLTITSLFAGPALIAWLLYRRLGGRGWLITALLGAGAATFIFTVVLAAEHILHPALLFALYAFTAAGMIMYWINRRRSADGRRLNARIEWERLGTREKTPAERDVPRAA